jgi:predicted transcriptional regulator of viral defense system
MPSLSKKILYRIYGGGKGKIYTSKDFVDLGNRAAVNQALSRLAKKAMIRRIKSGIYDYPRFNPKLGGKLTYNIHDVANAIARKNNIRIMESGACAANQLGLSTQVPARIFLLTDGPSRKVKVNNFILTFRHVSSKVMAIYGKKTEIVLRALIYIGKKYVDDMVIDKLCNREDDQLEWGEG